MFKRIILLICSFALTSPLVFCQMQTEYRHDGLFMRFLAGPSYSSQSFDGGSDDMKVDGLSVTFRFQIGATIAENLVAFGEAGGITIQNPIIEMNGKEYETEDTKASFFDMGGGMTYYFDPSNIYLTGSILLSKYQVEYNHGSTTHKGESDMGLGLFLGLGKEWWVSTDWALGVTGFFGYSNVPDQGSSDITITGTTFGVAFSATYQ